MEKKGPQEAARINGFERRWRILEYLRKNSDQEHPTSRARMRGVPDMKRFADGKETLNESVYDLATALNCDEDGSVLPQEQWKIVYPALTDYFGESDIEENNWDGSSVKAGDKRIHLPIKGLYYRHTFTYEEIDALIEGVLFSRMLDTQTANRLVDKIEKNLTTQFYKHGPRNVCTVQEDVPGNRDLLRENLLLIQQAIDDEVKIAFRFNGYDRRRELVPVRKERDAVSPYYIVANGGRYYLLACAEGRQTMSIWRIDLMTQLEIPGRNERCKGNRALKKREVEGLPQFWEENFIFRHVNMAYDMPVPITLRVCNAREWGDGKIRTNYTFLYDWFGDTFRYERTEVEPPYGDIVRVFCSPFAMANWALQYSDVVEVLEPECVREAVAEKVRNLNRKYGAGR